MSESEKLETVRLAQFSMEELLRGFNAGEDTTQIKALDGRLFRARYNVNSGKLLIVLDPTEACEPIP